MSPPPLVAAAPAVGARQAVVEHVLRTADELERCVRAASRASAPMVLQTAAGMVRAGDRERLLVGRSAAADVVLTSRHVSRRHAALVLRPDGWWVEDLGSRNGTWCNGERVLRHRLRDGDVLLVGGEAVRCRLR